MDAIETWNARADWIPGATSQSFTLPEGTLVRARRVVWDDGKGPTPRFPEPHAQPGAFGIVEYSGEVPCVRFFATGTATDVCPNEVEALEIEPGDTLYALLVDMLRAAP